MTILQQFIITYILSVTALAGAAVLWRNWLVDHESWKIWIERRLSKRSKILTCGSCFTFWLTLAFVLAFQPLHFAIGSVFPGDSFFDLAAHYIIQWLSLGWSAVFLRFLYVAIQEYVSDQVHKKEATSYPHSHT